MIAKNTQGNPCAQDQPSREYPGFEVFLIVPALSGHLFCILWPNFVLGVVEILMQKSSQFLASALETVRDYLWNFFVARTHFREPFVLVMHRFGKLRYFAYDFHIKHTSEPTVLRSEYILETAIFLALALRFVWGTDPRSRWLAFRLKYTFLFSCALGCRASSSFHRIPELYLDE